MINVASVSTGDPLEEQPPVVIYEDNSAPLDDIAFDEMNLVELPFALLTRDTDGIYEIPLSADGKSRLACLNSSDHGLPNSLAPRVVLGLMWMWKSGRDNGGQTFTFKLRELVERYMYPERFTRYAPNSDLLRSVERQINCIANSRIHTDRWWDHSLKIKQQANVAIISDVKVVNEGGRHRARVLQVTWGQAFWESMVRRYTKAIDARIVQSLVNPLDLQLYRLLDRQLATKSRQSYSDIVAFARYKIGMRGKTLDAGGRTASSYVAKKLGESLRRLRREQFTVVMTIDRSSEPFTVTFDRIVSPKAGQSNEVRDQDVPGDLVREFLFFAHGIPRDQKRARVAEADRRAAKEWLAAYGFDKAKWMVERCAKMQKERRGEPILVFRGLQFYENAAAGAYEQRQHGVAEHRERRLTEETDNFWNMYGRKLVAMFDSNVSADVLTRLEMDTREELQREMGDKPAYIVEAHLRGRLRAKKCARMNALSEEEFRAHRSLPALRDALVARHGAELVVVPTSSEPGAEPRQLAA
jgi:hypothetical protein